MRTIFLFLTGLTIAFCLPCAALALTQDVTLEPIAADEPIAPAGFPPIPERLDLGAAGAWSSSSGGASGGSAASSMRPTRPTYHQPYGHVQAGAYAPQRPARRYPTTGDVYSSSATAGMGPEPRLRADQASTPQAPSAVSVSQSTTQDLSLPEDGFSGNRPGRGSYIGRTAGAMARSAMWRAAGMGMMYGSYGLRF